jgi:NitT/TauT family transport system substrate-binding protein
MTTRGKIVLTLLILGVAAFGAYKWWDKLAPAGFGRGTNAPGSTASNDASAPAELVETQTEVPPLGAPAAYQPKDNTIDVELSEYAGYAGLITANG